MKMYKLMGLLAYKVNSLKFINFLSLYFSFNFFLLIGLSYGLKESLSPIFCFCLTSTIVLNRLADSY